MKRILFLLFVLLAAVGGTTACERTITQVIHDTTPGALRVDTLLLHRTDTLRSIRVDTVKSVRVDTVKKVDTVTKTVTLVGPPVHDTTTIVRIDTVKSIRVDTVKTVRVDTLTQIVVRVDTVTVPAKVTHDTAWVYTMTNPTNPLAGGDPNSGVIVLHAWEGFYMVFWHGNFVGVVYNYTPGWWSAWLSNQNSNELTHSCDKQVLEDAIACTLPLVMIVQPHMVEPKDPTPFMKP